MSAKSLVRHAASLYNVTGEIAAVVTGSELRDITLPYAVALLQVRDVERRIRDAKGSTFLAEVRIEVERLLDESDDHYRKQTERN